MSWFVRSKARARLAVTGHRLNLLPEARRPALQIAIAAILDAFAKAAAEAGRGRLAPILVSALAEGTDRFAAHAALGLGWRLEAPLPFRRGRYEEDFPAPESIAEFRALLARAARVHEIDGEALARDREDPAPYAAVGRALLAGADCVLAVWNGAPPKGPGGTGEVAALALAGGAPVIWLAPDAETPPALIAPERKTGRPHPFREALLAALASRFAPAERPAAMRVAAG